MMARRKPIGSLSPPGERVRVRGHRKSVFESMTEMPKKTAAGIERVIN